MDEFPVEDSHREAALAHLTSEHARGALPADELERRTADVRAAQTVAQLLAATAENPTVTPTPPSPVAHRNGIALVAGVIVAVLLLLVVLQVA